MSHLQRFGIDGDGRELLLVPFTDWASPLAGLPPLPEPFVCLFIADALGRDAHLIGSHMLDLINRGCRDVVTWGPDCERVHDICDEEFVVLHLDHLDEALENAMVMTEWFSKDPLTEALVYALFIAAEYDEHIRSIVVVCEDREDWVEVAAQALRNPRKFYDSVRADD